MTYFGYFRYDDIEIVNEGRLAAYAESLGLGWFQCRDVCADLDEAIKLHDGWQHGPYTDPLTDNAPWYDPRLPVSQLFAGMSVLSVTNLHASTYEGQVNELALDGAAVGSGRHTSREVLIRALLVGKSQHATHYGFNWLTSVLLYGDPCNVDGSRTHNRYAAFRSMVQYRKDEPVPTPDNPFQLNWAYEIALGPTAEDGNTYGNLINQALPEYTGRNPLSLGDPQDQRPCIGNKMYFAPVCPDLNQTLGPWRHTLDTTCLSPPRVLSEHSMAADDSCDDGGGAWMEVEFTLVMGNPGVWHDDINLSEISFGAEYELLATEWLYYKGGEAPPVDDDAYLAPSVANLPITYTGLYQTVYNRSAIVGATSADSGGGSISGVGQNPGSIVLDPACPTPPNFPDIPQADLLCAPIYTGEYQRRSYLLTASAMPRYLPMAMLIGLTVGPEDVRDARVSFYSGVGFQDEILLYFTYLPANSFMFIDTRLRRTDILVPVPGSDYPVWQSASHLVLHGEGNFAYDYQEILCPEAFTVAVDVPIAYPDTAITASFQFSIRDV